MSKIDPTLQNLREICAALPDTKETLTWGEPHFRVGDKIFAGCGDKAGRPEIGFKLEMAHAAQIIRMPGFEKAKYVGHKGWVSMDASKIKDWKWIRELIHESYALIAPKRSLEKMPPEPVTNVKPTAPQKRAVKTQRPPKKKHK